MLVVVARAERGQVYVSEMSEVRRGEGVAFVRGGEQKEVFSSKEEKHNNC